MGYFKLSVDSARSSTVSMGTVLFKMEEEIEKVAIKQFFIDLNLVLLSIFSDSH